MMLINYFEWVIVIIQTRLISSNIVTAWKVSVFGVFLVSPFTHSDWIRRDTEHLSVFSPNVGKYRPEKLRIRTLFTQCVMKGYGLDFAKNVSSKYSLYSNIFKFCKSITIPHITQFFCSLIIYVTFQTLFNKQITGQIITQVKIHP